MSRATLIKVCGVTSVEDARLVLESGADLVGLNLVGGPRQLTPKRAAEILDALPHAQEHTVLLTPLGRRGMTTEVEHLYRTHPQCALQLYGEVTPETVSRLASAGRRVLLVWHVENDASFTQVADFISKCEHTPAYLLLDAKVPGQLGGTGTRIAVETLNRARSTGVFAGLPPVILAGGLTAESVGQALAICHPAGVDVSSGVESTPGRKDPAEVKAFVAAVRGT